MCKVKIKQITQKRILLIVLVIIGTSFTQLAKRSTKTKINFKNTINKDKGLTLVIK